MYYPCSYSCTLRIYILINQRKVRINSSLTGKEIFLIVVHGTAKSWTPICCTSFPVHSPVPECVLCAVSFVCWHERESQTRKLVKNFGKNSARLLALPCSGWKARGALPSCRIRLQLDYSHNLCELLYAKTRVAIEKQRCALNMEVKTTKICFAFSLEIIKSPKWKGQH